MTGNRVETVRQLAGLGLVVRDDPRPRSMTIIFDVDYSVNRSGILENLARCMGWIYRPISNYSSAGEIRTTTGIKILAKYPLGCVDHFRNEIDFCDSVRQAIADRAGEANLAFRHQNGVELIQGAISVEKSSPSDKRSDAIIHRKFGRPIHVSLKMPNFGFWSVAPRSIAEAVKLDLLRSDKVIIERDGEVARIIGPGKTRAALIDTGSQRLLYEMIFGEERRLVLVASSWRSRVSGSWHEFSVFAAARNIHDLPGSIKPVLVARNQRDSRGAIRGIKIEIQPARKVTAGYARLSVNLSARNPGNKLHEAGTSDRSQED